MTSLGRLVKRLRIQNKWTQTQLSKRSGVSQAAISDIETGVKTYVNKKQRVGLLLAFSISAEEFEKLLEAQIMHDCDK